MSTQSNDPVDTASADASHDLQPPVPPVESENPQRAPAPGGIWNLARKLDWRVVAVLLLVGISLPIWHAMRSQARAEAAVPPAAPTVLVPVGTVTREDIYNEVPFPAEFRPYEEVELHAKVSGYVSDMKVDFGDRVKAGQLLATLEVPELMSQLTNSVAIEHRAQAEYRAAHLNYTRLAAVSKDNPNLVAEQDLDTAEAKDGTSEAAIAAAKADVERYHTLVAYTRITAPFDGVITHRYVDPGTLIQSGTSSDTQSLPVVRISDNYRLRLDFPVEVKYVKDIRCGDSVEIQVESLGDKTFSGRITRAADSINEDTRTMTTEIEVPNPNLELVPGMYAKVLLKVEHHPNALAIPIQAVPPGQTSTVYVVNDQNEIEERRVTLGMDTPTKYEVLSGLKEGEKVLMGSRSLVHPGQKVETKVIGPLAQD